MASHEVDRVLEELDATLRQLRDAIRGIPARKQGFVAAHDRVAKSAALLSVWLSDARGAIT